MLTPTPSAGKQWPASSFHFITGKFTEGKVLSSAFNLQVVAGQKNKLKLELQTRTFS
jgi:hypothetical protein